MLLVALVAANAGRIDRASKLLRAGSLALIGTISVANASSAARLVVGLVQGALSTRAHPLLLSGGAIWLTNVIAFALWYWEVRPGRAGGPGSGDSIPP